MISLRREGVVMGVSHTLTHDTSMNKLRVAHDGQPECQRDQFNCITIEQTLSLIMLSSFCQL
jgi:hypothetical protein